MTSLLEDELDPGGRWWYDRAKKYYDAWDGDPTQYMEQARIWLTDRDFGLAHIAWVLVDLEHKNAEDLG